MLILDIRHTWRLASTLSNIVTCRPPPVMTFTWPSEDRAGSSGSKLPLHCTVLSAGMEATTDYSRCWRVFWIPNKCKCFVDSLEGMSDCDAIEISTISSPIFNPRLHILHISHPRTNVHGGGAACHPHAISPPIEIELWDKDQTNSWNVLSPVVTELTSLGHILTPPGRVKVKKIAIWWFTVFRK